MCDPVIAGGAMLAMSGIQAYTQYQQGKYASKVAEANADIATAQANDAINRGNAEAEQRRRETRQRLGTQAATMGATGADLSTGNALDILFNIFWCWEFYDLLGLPVIVKAGDERFCSSGIYGNYHNWIIP